MSSCPSCGQNIPNDARYCGTCGHQATDPAGRNGLVGTVIAERYRVLRVIAEGGMGIVYEAEQPMGEGVRRVAVKTLLPELSRDPVVVSRFNRECSVVAGLEHPNTVRVYDFGTTDQGTLYIAMEFVGGRPLGEVIAEGPMPLQRCLGIMEQIASALEEAHNQGIVHRDLKPDNLVLCDRAGLHDFVKVLDFGIAKRSSAGGKHDTNLTQQGMVLGTPPYMSPEQFTGEPLDCTSDIYSLAIIFYEMMNSKLPFDDVDTPWQWAHQHISVEPAPFAVAVPHELQEVVRSALSKQKSERPQSALEFYRRLCAASGTSLGSRSRVIEPEGLGPARAGSVAKGDTSPDVPAQGVRTEPSMVRMAPEPPTLGDRQDSSLAVGTTAPAGPALSGGMSSRTGTDPSGPVIGVGARGVAASVVLAPSPVRRRASSRRTSRVWVLGISVAAIAAGAGASAIWWAVSQRIVLEEPPRPSALGMDSAATEIAAEVSPVRRVAADSTKPVTQVAPGRVATAPATPRPSPTSSTSGHAGTQVSSQPIPATATSTGTPTSAATASNPFPFPFPIALPPILTTAGLPPFSIPTPGATSTPTPAPTVQQPTPQVPTAGIQQCAQASTLADTDLDAAVSQYQLCENAVGRTGATAARAKIAAVGVARATSLASQGRCEEASRVVQTLSRIGAHRNAQRATTQAGCR